MRSSPADIRLTEGRTLAASGHRTGLTLLAFAVAVAGHGAVLAALINYTPQVALPPIAIDLIPADLTADPIAAPQAEQAQVAAEPPAEAMTEARPEEDRSAAAPTPEPPPLDQTAEIAPEPKPETPVAALREPEPPLKPVQPLEAPEPAITAPPAQQAVPPTPQVQKPPPEKTPAKPPPKTAKPLDKPVPKPLAKPKERPQAEARTAQRPSPAAGTAAANRPAASGQSTAAYASLVAAALNRLKVYPAAARQSGASGSVGVSFTIGASGRVTSSSIRSSGNGMLDSAVRQMLASLQVPPPPGGVFRTGTTISFSLR